MKLKTIYTFGGNESEKENIKFNIMWGTSIRCIRYTSRNKYFGATKSTDPTQGRK